MRFIIVPGWRNSGPGHWQSLWAERLAGAYARAWGSEFVRLPEAGHINIASGHGEGPLGVALLQSLAGDASLTTAYQNSSFSLPLPSASLETA